MHDYIIYYIYKYRIMVKSFEIRTPAKLFIRISDFIIATDHA